MTIIRERKSKFVKLFDKTHDEVFCPHFYELVLSNGCPYDCSYCYLKLTFRGNTEATLFNNNWDIVKSEIDAIHRGVFSTGELADSLAEIPPLLPQCIDYFTLQKNKYLLIVTKSTNIDLFRQLKPCNNIIISFSINDESVAKRFEKAAPNPYERLEAASELISKGWRVRIRLDPIILETVNNNYRSTCSKIAALNPERVTIGTIRHYPTLFNFAPNAPRRQLCKSKDGRMRYPADLRIEVYRQIANWLGFEPALCKETKEVWEVLGWRFDGCNCTS